MYNISDLIILILGRKGTEKKAPGKKVLGKNIPEKKKIYHKNKWYIK
jgi:hypothetical protein